MPDDQPMECVIEEESSGRRVTFTEGLTVGRHPSSCLCLPRKAVSSRHAVLEYREGRWRVRDLGSRNGTSVDGRRIHTWEPLREGAALRFAGGEAWLVRRLVEPAVHLTSTTGSALPVPGSLRLVLTPRGPGQGVVSVCSGGAPGACLELGLGYVLVEMLARSAGEWVDDEALKTALWGRLRDRVSRSALHFHLEEVRGALERLGLPREVLEKKRGQTRLALGREQVGGE